MITYQDYERATDKLKWLRNAIISYRNSDEYKKALEEEEYMAGRNVEILNVQRVIYNMAGLPENDFTKSNVKIRNRIINRLVTDRCSYLLGNGVSFPDQEKTVANGKTHYVDPVKDTLGKRFDKKLKNVAYWACSNGTAYLYVHMGHDKPEWQYTVFKKSEFLPLYDEEDGTLRGGIRFWSLDWGKRPIQAVFYREEGYEKYQTPEKKYGVSSLELKQKLQPYIETVETSEAFGEEVVSTGTVTRLPIFPLCSGENRDSALDNLKPLIDSYDIVLSGFANDVSDIPQIYWLISGAMGMKENDKRQLLDRLILQHMAVVDGDNSKIQGFTQDIPYEARERCLKQLKSQMYENYGGFDVHTVEAGATNDHIEAGYLPMDEEADAFEGEIIEMVQDILEMIGVTDHDTTPQFKRNRVSNQKEQTDMVIAAADYLDDRTVLEHLPWLTVDEVDDVLMRKDGESFDRFDDGEDNNLDDDDGGSEGGDA